MGRELPSSLLYTYRHIRFFSFQFTPKYLFSTSDILYSYYPHVRVRLIVDRFGNIRQFLNTAQHRIRFMLVHKFISVSKQCLFKRICVNMYATKLLTSCRALFNLVLTHRFFNYIKHTFCREYFSLCTVMSLLSH